MKDLTVLVVGAGAIGQWLGARMGQVGYNVTLLTTKRHVDALAHGIVIRGHTELSGNVKAVSEVPRGPFNVIVLTAKAHQTAILTEKSAPLLAKDGVFLTLQNGLGNAEKVAHFLAKDRVAVGLTSNGVTMDFPGRLHHAGVGPTIVGAIAGASPDAAKRAQAIVDRTGLDPQWSDDMRAAVWRKAIVNAGANPVAAIHKVRNGDLLDRADLRELALKGVAEGTRLATAAAVRLPAGDIGAALLATLEKTRPNKISMLQDVESRRPTETEQILGRMVRLAKRLDVATPELDILYTKMKDLEASYLGAPAAKQLAADEMKWEKERF